jgi:hypothetical protein
VNEGAPHVPVYYPTEEEFLDFSKYIARIERDCNDRFGIVKVVPPKSWDYLGSKSSAVEKVFQKVIKPVKQYTGTISLGSYRVDLVEAKKQTVEDFKTSCETKHVQRPSLMMDLPKHLPFMKGVISHPKLQDDENLFSDSDESGGEDCSGKKSASFTFSGRWASNETDMRAGITGTFSYDFHGWEDFCQTKNTSHESCEASGSFVDMEGNKVDDRFCLYRLPCLRNKSPSSVEEQHILGHGTNDFGTYRIAGILILGTNTMSLCREYHCPDAGTCSNRSVSESEERRSEILKYFEALSQRDEFILEKHFWRSIGSTVRDVPMYGGDQLGTIFGDHPTSWNVGHLDTILSLGIGKNVEGITAPMLYFGMWRAMFAWHTEDLELNSINYLHFGEPKVWYSVHRNEAERFESACASKFTEISNKCKEFMRHKNVLTSPTFLRDRKIPYGRCVQYAGEFVLTFPRGYHSGFNTGFNCAESTNFASPKWIPFGRKAHWCKCEPYTLRINMDSFVERVRSIDPSRLPSAPQIGDRICVRWKDDPKAYVCRVVKGKKGSALHVVPAVSGELFFDLAFDPSVDEWEWPSEFEMSTLSVVERSENTQTAIESLKKQLRLLKKKRSLHIEIANAKKKR